MRQLKIKITRIGREPEEVVINEFDDVQSIEIIPDVTRPGIISKKFAATYGGALIDVLESGGKLIRLKNCSHEGQK